MADANATRTCVVCGGLFPRYKIKAVCSDACAAIRQRKYQATSNARKVKPSRQCKWCNAEFVIGELTGTNYCSQDHARLAKIDRDKARDIAPEQRAAWSRTYNQKHADKVRERGRIRAAVKRAKHGRGDRSKEYEARRIKIGRPDRRMVSVDSLMVPIGRMVRAFRGAEQSIRRMVGRCDSPVYGMTEVEEFRWMYRNDPLFRQAQIQRSKTQKLRRKKQQNHALTVKEAQAVYAERSSCLYCGCHLAIGDKVLDHMDPLSKGGAHDASNLVVACKKCNTRKAAKEFVKWLPLVAEGRRKLVADWYARKHGAPPEQIGLGLLMAA